ncbi:MAG: ComEC/Rec2 family competence protein, partial [Clostridia bacterium]|nr:ComEC/Rec2 family competence protein [Clostridia bacterium]
MNTTDFKVTRPIVLTSLACVICLYIILCGAFGALLSIILCCASVIIIGAVLLISDGLKPLFVFFACVIICCLNATFSYITHEKAAISFIDKMKENSDCLYEVQITSCRNYSAYAVADGVILSCDGKAINRSYKCRFSCYSGEGLEEGNIVYFKGVPQFPSNDEDEVFDNVSYLRSRKCFIVFSNVSIISSKLGPLSLRNKIHKSIERIIYLNVPQGNSFECGDLCYSVLLGNKQFLDSDLKDSFTKSGIIHLICVSGMHLSVIMGAVFAFLKFLGTKNHISAV